MIVRPWQFESVIIWSERLLHQSEVKLSPEISGKVCLCGASQEWTSFYDLMPDTETPFLHSTDGRKPLSFLASLILGGTGLTFSNPPQPRLKTIERICGERPGTRFRLLSPLRPGMDPPKWESVFFFSFLGDHLIIFTILGVHLQKHLVTQVEVLGLGREA